MSELSNFVFNNDNPNRFVSGFQNQDGVTSPFLTDNIYVDDNDVLHASPNFDIEKNLSEINSLLNSYADLLKIYHAKMRVYKGDHAALHRSYFNPLFQKIEDKDMSINIPKNMVNTFAGFFAGIPAKVNYVPSGSSPNDPLDPQSQKINDWISNALNNNNYSDILFEWAKKADIYGRSYAISYIGRDKQIHFKDLSPENCLIVYDNSLNENPLFAIYFVKLNDSYNGTIYTDKHQYDFNNESLTDTDQLKQVENPLGKVPVSELPENDERLGIFDDAINAIDKLDKVYSLKYNDVYYFSNAILFLVGFDKLNDLQQKSLKSSHVLQPIDKHGKAINTDETNIDAKFLSKPQNDTQQEHFIDRVTSQIYQNAGIINLSDPQLGSSASGDALGKKLQPMVMLADSKARKMNSAFKQILAIMLTQCKELGNQTIDDVVADIQVKFTVNIPQSLLDESQVIKNLYGIVSTPTLLSIFSGINNVQREMQQIEEEKQKNMQNFGNAPNNDGNDGDYLSDNNSDSSGDKDE